MTTDLSQWDMVEDDSDCGMLLNGQPVIASDEADDGIEQEQDIRDWLDSMGLDENLKTCPMCGYLLTRAHRIEWQDDDDGVFDRELQILSCCNCAYWFYCNCQNVGASAYGCPCATKTTSRLPCLKRFSECLPIGCATELAQQLRRAPSRWHVIGPREFERFVADVFRANHTGAEVIHVGKPSDGGTDIFFVDAGDEWLIQVKRRESPTASEGVGTLRSLLGTLVLEGTKCGMIVSTADHFTYQAVRAKEKAEKIGFSVLLHDRGVLNRMLDRMLPDRPWLRFVREEQPDWYEHVAASIPSRRQQTLF